MDQNHISKQNRIAWEAQPYQAWVVAHGAPNDAAQVLLQDPKRKLRRILPHLNNPKGERIANPLGSHGRVAVALALLGADVTVFDISAPNERYAIELAKCANVSIEYVVGDFLETASHYDHEFDRVVMELGILHYFNNLDDLVRVVRLLLKLKGTVVLTDFHPLLKKAIHIHDGRVELGGDYFSTDVLESSTPYEVFLNETLPTCLIRRWTLGEIVTAFAQNGFRINKLIEEPSIEASHLPGTFTLVATAE